jgi:hypothetical protein
METTGFGLTRERFRGAVELPATRFTTQTSVLVGHQWNQNGLFVAAFIGPEIHHEQLTIAGRVYRFSQPRYGVRGQFELWANPTENTLLTATVVPSTAQGSLWARASAGMRMVGKLFAGPEVAAYATEGYREFKIGAHLTGLQFGLVQGRVSAGWMTTDEKRPGAPYVGLAAWIRI